MMGEGLLYRGWALSVAGKCAEGILSIERGISDFRATGALVLGGYNLALKAEALYMADRSYDALEAIKEAELLAERFDTRAYDALFLRLRGVFLTAIGAEETQIEFSFARPSESQRTRNRFCWRAELKQRTQNTVAKKRAPQEDVHSDSLFYDFLVRAVFSLPYALVRPSSARPGADVRVRTSGGKRR